MRRVHIAPTLLDAQLISDTLASLGIPNHILNVHASGALGDLPFMQAQPEIWIEDDAQTERAREALLHMQTASASDGAPCPRCGETNPGNFLSCWNCGGALGG
ncbi:DUF2007 domain-containing protein [Betaproteobacteria bacterium SCN1]|jgi:hypothetical protein|nr:DUF2007 domain-containing protein [Betaproteobacteria bacterium SCN1]MBN8761152.1 DUF2007 domain-containing protein [Thiobacillus sp.]ODU87494.1 MAG: hypothetical protein ABT21_13115 [Thiobacillus sp. SCN 65-179]OJW38757.1 MAG: hypothetical protein BGO61_13875 [Thiobacillus sp. 65-69]